jgi:hypothetical protein
VFTVINTQNVYRIVLHVSYTTTAFKQKLHLQRNVSKPPFHVEEYKRRLHETTALEPWTVRNLIPNHSKISIVRLIKSRGMRWTGHVACLGDMMGVHRFLVGRPEGKSLIARPRCRWEDNIKTQLQEVEWEDTTGLIWLRIRRISGHLCRL